MALRLYADECVDARIVAGLRRRGVDVGSASEEGLLRAPDARQMEHAIALGRVIVTADHDFLALADDLVARGGRFPGVLFILPYTMVGDAVRAIALVALAREPRELANRIEWIK